MIPQVVERRILTQIACQLRHRDEERREHVHRFPRHPRHSGRPRQMQPVRAFLGVELNSRPEGTPRFRGAAQLRQREPSAEVRHSKLRLKREREIKPSDGLPPLLLAAQHASMREGVESRCRRDGNRNRNRDGRRRPR